MHKTKFFRQWQNMQKFAAPQENISLSSNLLEVRNLTKCASIGSLWLAICKTMIKPASIRNGRHDFAFAIQIIHKGIEIVDSFMSDARSHFRAGLYLIKRLFRQGLQNLGNARGSFAGGRLQTGGAYRREALCWKKHLASASFWD